MKKKFIYFLICLTTSLFLNAAEIQKSVKFDSASMSCDGKNLSISTGKVKRELKWTGKGWLTADIVNLNSGKEWPAKKSDLSADWNIPGVSGKAELISVSATAANDEGFTSKHLEIISTIAYPESGMQLQHVIWAYPEAPGLRTQIRLKKTVARAESASSAILTPQINLTKFRLYTPPAFLKSRPFPDAFGTTASHDSQLELKIEGLDSGKRYALGFSWCDWGGGGRYQSVLLTSIDGEEKQIVVENEKLPGWLNGQKKQPGIHVVQLQESLYPDGTIKMFVKREKRSVASACISELWLYEYGAEQALKNGVPKDRIKAINAGAPENAKLAAYLNCGGKMAPPARTGNREAGICERVPMAMDRASLAAVGYYSDTQHRNKPDTEIIREETLKADSGKNDWASILSVTHGNDGLLLIKESHKCVNTPKGGANTGGFIWDNNGIAISGTGWYSENIDSDRWYPCWANWLVLYQGGEDEQALTLKIWDRIRYPIDPKRDLYIMANTWGSTSRKRNAQIQAREDNVLAEIESQADLGIDVQQIDDGWQGFKYDHWRPIKKNTLTKEDAAYEIYKADKYPVYPEGWENVKEYARKKGVTMGLWSANRIPTDDLKWNYDEGDFRYYKIDFANLKTMRDVEQLMQRARSLVLHSGHKVRINWDVTEISPRVGYFFGREYGNIYLENRKPVTPAHVVYRPYLVLRNAWQVSKYLNLNKFQVTVQNVDRTNREISDAYQHPHDYCVAQTLMGSPIFFQETHYYSEEARKAIRPLLKVYKEHRKDMFDGYVFPIGEKPDNSSWSGFQCVIPEKNRGYLTLFRQLENTEKTKKIKLKFLKPGTEIELTNLMTGEKTSAKLDGNCTITFTINQAPGFRFFQYKVM